MLANLVWCGNFYCTLPSFASKLTKCKVYCNRKCTTTNIPAGNTNYVPTSPCMNTEQHTGTKGMQMYTVCGGSAVHCYNTHTHTHALMLCWCCVLSCRKTKRRSVHWEFIDGTRHRTLLHVLFIHSSNKFLPDYYDATFSAQHFLCSFLVRSWFVRSFTQFSPRLFHSNIPHSIHLFYFSFSFRFFLFLCVCFVAVRKIIWVPDLT